MARIYVLLALLVFSVSCTRSVDTEASLSFQFKNVSSGPSASSASNGYYPSKVIINVKYDGQSHFQEWNCPQSHSGNIAGCVLPPSIPINRSFPAGSNRLVQVLLVYENQNEQMEFFYSDKTLAFSGGVANVVVGDAGWEHNASSQVRVEGRLASSAGTVNVDQLSGRVIGYYQPQNINKPPMAVIQKTIFAGWFDFMFLSGVKFTYVHKDSGRVLFNKKSAEDISAAMNVHDNTQVVKVNIPAHKKVFTRDERVSYTTMPLAGPAGGWGAVGDLQDVVLQDGRLTGFGYLHTTAPASDILDVHFPFNINLKFMEIKYDTANPIVATSLGLDFGGEMGEIAILAEGSSSTTNNQAYSDFTTPPLNGYNELSIELPDVAGLRITELTITREVHGEYLVPQEMSYVGFFDIDTQNFKLGNGGANNGVTHTTVSPAYEYDGSPGKALNVVPSIIAADVNGTWLSKEIDLVSANFIKYDGTSSASGDNYAIERAPSSLATGCYSITDTCIPVDHLKFHANRLLEIQGPMKYQTEFGSCSSGSPNIACTVYYSFVPGFTGGLQFFKLPSAINLHESEDFDCKAMEQAGYGAGTITTNAQAGGSDLTYNNMAAGKIFYCPFLLLGGEKKYLGWGDRVYYKSN